MARSDESGAFSGCKTGCINIFMKNCRLIPKTIKVQVMKIIGYCKYTGEKKYVPLVRRER